MELKYRDAVSGEYVSKEYALMNPDTTVAETASVEHPDGVDQRDQDPQRKPERNEVEARGSADGGDDEADEAGQQQEQIDGFHAASLARLRNHG